MQSKQKVKYNYILKKFFCKPSYPARNTGKSEVFIKVKPEPGPKNPSRFTTLKHWWVKIQIKQDSLRVGVANRHSDKNPVSIVG